MRSIVLADDEPIVRMDLSAMLSDLGFVVAGQGADGFDAVELCRRRRPDIALLDIRMPVFDGLTAAETIFNEALAECILLLTAYSDRETVSRAAAIGVAGYLVKPIRQQELFPALEVAWQQSRRLRESRMAVYQSKQQLASWKTVERAKGILVRRENISTADAYALLRRSAMDKRRPLSDIAAAVVAREESARRLMQRAKAVLAGRHGVSEDEAYRMLCRAAAQRGVDPAAYAQELLRE